MTNSNKVLGIAIVGSSAALALAAPSVLADELIQEVVVTAQKRQESLQTTPIAISAFSADALNARGITNLEGVTENVPSVTVLPFVTSSTELFLYIRGQGVSDPSQVTADGAVGLYEDGFYIARPQFVTFDLADVDRVEVLRGPQGTLYGRNTTGGAVNIISKKPTGEFGIKEDLDGGNLNYFRSLTSINLPAWNGLSTKVTVLDSHRDGIVKNLGPSNDYDLSNQRAGRAALHWENSDAFQVDYFFETARADTTPEYWQTPSLAGVVAGYTAPQAPTTTWEPINLPLSHSKFNQNGLTLTWNVSDELTIKSLTGYRDSRNDPYQDFADAFSSPFSGGATTGLTIADHYTDHELTQEFQFVGDLLNHRIKYVGGLYYFKEGGGHFENVRIAIPAFGYSESDLRYVRAYSKSQAAYTQVTWTPPVLNDKLSLTVGGRYTKDNKSATRHYFIQIPPGTSVTSEIGASNVQQFSKFNPAFTMAYNWNDDVNTYLRVATGYKAGGSDEAATPGDFGITFGPENITSYELGLKSYEFDRHVRFNLALFESKFKDLQLDFDTDPANPSFGLTLNAGKATVQGAEVDLLVAPTEDLNLTASYTYLHPEINEVIAPAGTLFDPTINSASPYHVGENVAELFALSEAPKSSYNVGADYTFLHLTESDLSLHMNFRWQDVVFLTVPTGPAVPGRYLYSLPSYGLLNGRLTWTFNLRDSSTARVSLWSKNLANKKWLDYTNGLGGPFLPLPGQPPGYTYQVKSWGEPRTFGVNLVYEF